MTANSLRVFPGKVSVDAGGATARDTREKYIQAFHLEENGEAVCTWSGSLSTETGELISAEMNVRPRWLILHESSPSGISGDPADPCWEQIARDFLSRIRKNGLDGVILQNSKQVPINSEKGVELRFLADTGGTYTLTVPYALKTVLFVSYRDEMNQRLFDKAVSTLPANQ